MSDKGTRTRQYEEMCVCVCMFFFCFFFTLKHVNPFYKSNYEPENEHYTSPLSRYNNMVSKQMFIYRFSSAGVVFPSPPDEREAKTDSFFFLFVLFLLSKPDETSQTMSRSVRRQHNASERTNSFIIQTTNLRLEAIKRPQIVGNATSILERRCRENQPPEDTTAT